jgi:hypothetical protein
LRALRIRLVLPVAILLSLTPGPAVHAQEEPEAKGDVSTENNPNLGQLKDQKVIQEDKNTERPGSKKDPGAAQDRPAHPGHGDTRPERPQRVERPMRPERPHR